jgi:hypothetical protein
VFDSIDEKSMKRTERDYTYLANGGKLCRRCDGGDAVQGAAERCDHHAGIKEKKGKKGVSEFTKRRNKCVSDCHAEREERRE